MPLHNFGVPLAQDTGWYGASPNDLRLLVAGVEIVKVDANGFSFTVAPVLNAPVRAPNGSVSAPAYSFTSDTDTGFYRVADATIGVSTNGTERARFSTAGLTIRGQEALRFGAVTAPTAQIALDTNGLIFGLVAGGSTWYKSAPVAVSALPAAATAGAGARMFVNDADTPTFGSAVTGGGAVAVPVYSDGTNWIVG